MIPDTVSERLATSFGLHRSACPSVPGVVPIGIEIEVPWSSYFPELWSHFDLARRGFKDLSAAEIIDLSAQCSRLEDHLQPKLLLTREAGIHRGNDRYYEFAHDPETDVSELTEQVRLLTLAGVLPRDRQHSLQITIGNVCATRDVYYLAMLLELQVLDAARIDYGLSQARGTIFTGWARKGRSGVYEKGASDLKLGSQVACELRVLSLPCDDASFVRLMGDASWGANAIHAIQAGVHDEGVERWHAFVAKASEALRREGLPDRNWVLTAAGNAGEITGGATIDESAWLRFADSLDVLRETLAPRRSKMALRA